MIESRRGAPLCTSVVRNSMERNNVERLLTALSSRTNDGKGAPVAEYSCPPPCCALSQHCPSAGNAQPVRRALMYNVPIIPAKLMRKTPACRGYLIRRSHTKVYSREEYQTRKTRSKGKSATQKRCRQNQNGSSRSCRARKYQASIRHQSAGDVVAAAHRPATEDARKGRPRCGYRRAAPCYAGKTRYRQASITNQFLGQYRG